MFCSYLYFPFLFSLLCLSIYNVDSISTSIIYVYSSNTDNVSYSLLILKGNFREVFINRIVRKTLV